MTKKEFCELADSLTPMGNGKMASAGNLCESKRRWLNYVVGQLRALRETYHDDPLIKEICTNTLSGCILIDTE